MDILTFYSAQCNKYNTDVLRIFRVILESSLIKVVQFYTCIPLNLKVRSSDLITHLPENKPVKAGGGELAFCIVRI